MFLLPKISTDLGGVLIILEFGALSVHILAVVILIIRLFFGFSSFSARSGLFNAMSRCLSLSFRTFPFFFFFLPLDSDDVCDVV